LDAKETFFQIIISLFFLFFFWASFSILSYSFPSFLLPLLPFLCPWSGIGSQQGLRGGMQKAKTFNRRR
jgi:hypothetical protein